jgi:hypothetical protein
LTTSAGVNCPTCSTHGQVVRKLDFEWRTGSIPPHLGLYNLAFRHDINIILTQLGKVMTTNRRSNSTDRRGSRAAVLAGNVADRRRPTLTSLLMKD